jgi:hypothetical protein
MPRLDLAMIKECQTALDLVTAGENVRYAAGPGTFAYRELSIMRLEALYELAFLRIFVSWETFHSGTFCRYLCGYVSRLGRETLTHAAFFPTLSQAHIAAKGAQKYLNWYDPYWIIKRCQKHMVNGLHEKMFAAAQTRLDYFTVIRHRIAHSQSSRKDFDTATGKLSGKAYSASRPGRFLRDWDTDTSPPQRWIRTISDELNGYAGQVM